MQVAGESALLHRTTNQFPGQQYSVDGVSEEDRDFASDSLDYSPIKQTLSPFLVQNKELHGSQQSSPSRRLIGRPRFNSLPVGSHVGRFTVIQHDNSGSDITTPTTDDMNVSTLSSLQAFSNLTLTGGDLLAHSAPSSLRNSLDSPIVVDQYFPQLKVATHRKSSSDKLQLMQQVAVNNALKSAHQTNTSSSGNSTTTSTMNESPTTVYTTNQNNNNETTTGKRVPMYSPMGKIIGYRQDSSMMKPFMSFAIPSSTSMSNSSVTDGGSRSSTPTFHNNHQTLDAAEFAEAAGLTFKGFLDATNQIPGYVLGPELGRGGFCIVRKAMHEATGQIAAIKMIEKARLKDPKDQDRVNREMRVMRHLAGHVGIAQLLECVETPKYLYIIMEHCPNGSLLDHVRAQKKLPEHESALVLQQLLHALHHCHSKGVIHRDVKLENILMDTDNNVKLIDFGLSGYFMTGKRLRCHCGSPSYAAPEIVGREEYDAPPVDIWSLGVVLYSMLAGYLPFYAKDKKELSQKILSGYYKPLKDATAEAQDLVSRMLTLDPAQRITIDQIWAHPWLSMYNRWCPLGVGIDGLMRFNVDDNGLFQPDEHLVNYLEQNLGVDAAALVKSLRLRECSALTTHYHLLYNKPGRQMQYSNLNDDDVSSYDAEDGGSSTSADSNAVYSGSSNE